MDENSKKELEAFEAYMHSYYEFMKQIDEDNEKEKTLVKKLEKEIPCQISIFDLIEGDKKND